MNNFISSEQVREQEESERKNNKKEIHVLTTYSCTRLSGSSPM